MSEPPNTSTRFQLAFNRELEYHLVLDNPKSQQQIFKYLPEGLAYGLQISSDDVGMQNLEAYDTSAQLGYVTTLASTWIPSDHVDSLRRDLVDNKNIIYNNPNHAINEIMSLLLPSIPPLDSTALNPSPNPGSIGLKAGIKVIIGVLIPVAAIACLVLIVAYNREQRRRENVTSRNRANAMTGKKGWRPFFQKKPELDGEDQMHEVSAEERWMEVDGEGSRRQELQGAEIGMELHGEAIRRQELQCGEIAIELHGEASRRQELQGEEIWMELHGNGRQEREAEDSRHESVAAQTGEI